MEFRYQLEKDEYRDYCKFEIYQNDSTRKMKRRCQAFLPVIWILLLIALRPTNPVYYILAAITALIWLWLVKYMVARVVIRGANAKCDHVDEHAFRPIHLVIGEGSLRVNGTTCRLKTYRFFSSLIMLLMEDGSMVLLPARVFGTDEESLSRVVTMLKKCM